MKLEGNLLPGAQIPRIFPTYLHLLVSVRFVATLELCPYPQHKQKLFSKVGEYYEDVYIHFEAKVQVPLSATIRWH